MSNKLMYRLGLEELSEIAPVTEVPTNSAQQTELELNQLGNELHGDVQLVLSNDYWKHQHLVNAGG